MRSNRKWPRLAYPLVLVLAASLMAVVAPAPADADQGRRGSVQREPTVAGHHVRGTKVTPKPTGA